MARIFVGKTNAKEMEANPTITHAIQEETQAIAMTKDVAFSLYLYLSCFAFYASICKIQIALDPYSQWIHFTLGADR